MLKSRRTLLAVATLLLALAAVAWYGGWRPTSPPVIEAPTTVPTVTKTSSAALTVAGKLGDNSYNDLTHAGFLRAAKELGLDYRVVEPADPSEMRVIIQRLAADRTNLVVGIGFTARAPMEEIAQAHPDVRFLLIDDTSDKAAANLRSVYFREHEAGFLAGVVAATFTKTGKVGIVIGMDLPVVRRYVNGYKAGVKHVRPDVQVLSSVVGSFSDPAKGRSAALGIYSAGADVILNGAGQTGNGIFEAARQSKRYAIGVDRDQSEQAPEFVLTSALKHVDDAIYLAVKTASTGTFVPGKSSLGVADGAIALAPLLGNKFSAEQTAAVQNTVEAIRTGELKVEESYEPL